jgi:hypothetical protein
VQQRLFVRTDELVSAPRHRFYEKLNELLDGAGFDAFVEDAFLRSARSRADRAT